MSAVGWQRQSLPLTPRSLPAPGTLEVWLCNIAALPLQAGPDGSGRREQVLRRRIQQQFLLRLLLGSYLDRPGKDLRLVRGEHGKPALAKGQSSNGLQFNLSHSGDWLALVFGSGAGVGVDIEVHRTLRRAGDLARRYLPASEADWLNSLAEPERSRAFIAQWTAREALVKARGSSLAQSVAGLALDWSPTRISALPPGWPSAEQWTLLAPAAPAELGLHIASPEPGLDCRLFHLELAG
ncbi:MAG: 4'-phosphopantetheinyl transferase superfamily protein [Wenzhouxiangella sp.]